MPIFPVPPEVQAAVSGQNLPAANIGQGFDQFMARLRQQQDAGRTVLDAIGRQTPGFMAYLTANHPDIVEEVTGPPRLFRAKDAQPLSARLQAAMQGFMAQPPPAEAPVSGAESASIRRGVEDYLGKQANFRTLPPQQQAAAHALADHMFRATSNDDAAQTFGRLQSLLGTEPTAEQQKYQSVLELGSDPALGMTPEERADKAFSYATNQPMDPKDKRLLDARMGLKAEKLRDLEIIAKEQDIAQKKNEAAHGKAIPVNMINDLSGLGYVSKRVIRAADMIDKFGFGETNLGNLLHAPAYSEDAAAYNALLNDLGEDVIRFTKDIRGRVSAGLLDLLRASLMSYDKTPTQLRGILNVTVANVIDRHEAILDSLRAAGVGSDAYFDAEEANLQPLRDLEARLRKAAKEHPTKPTTTWRQRLFGGGPGAAAPTPEDVLFGGVPKSPEPE